MCVCLFAVLRLVVTIDANSFLFTYSTDTAYNTCNTRMIIQSTTQLLRRIIRQITIATIIEIKTASVAFDADADSTLHMYI